MENKMTNKFSEKLDEFLKSECDDYGLNYSWKWNEDLECCEVEVKRYDKSIKVQFRFDSDKEMLSIEVCEDYWEEVEEYSYNVKYFWIVVAPVMFG